jgi:GTP-binding protein
VASKLPIISIVGRPNVGKSSLFNRIIHKRQAVVDAVAGSTRDRNYARASWDGVDFIAVDTGGLVPASHDAIPRAIHQQVEIALKESDAVIFVVEAGTGPTDLDLQIARRLRKIARDKTVLVVNKSESRSARLEIDSFISLGMGEPLAISALHGAGVGDILDAAVGVVRASGKHLRAAEYREPLKIAVVGRPNAGKSSLVNRFLRAERMIVDEKPGTTRDAVDTDMTYHGRDITLIDTAGLRKKSHVDKDVEYYCNLRSIDSIKRSDISVLVIDALHGIGEQDLKILEKIVENRKGVVAAWNKWDIVEKNTKTFDGLAADARDLYMELQHVPMIATSAVTGQRVDSLLDAAIAVHERMTFRVPAAEFSDLVHEWTTVYPHPQMQMSKQVRVLGVKQRQAWFPLFFMYASNHDLVLPMYARYLANKIYKQYDFDGCPVVVEFRPPARQRSRA